MALREKTVSRLSVTVLCCAAAAALFAACGWCEEQQQVFSEEVNDTGKDKFVAARTEKPPKIDGALDDECWKDATRLTTFRISTQPGQGLLAEQQTEVLVSSDRQALYFAFICRESEVGKIAAHQTQYDGSFDLDDRVDVGLDTFCDKTRSYVFTVNPLGTRADSRWGDLRWNARWQAAAKIGKGAWTVEMAVPFSILTMPRKANKFGFNCGRGLRRKAEYSFWKYTKNYSDRQFIWAELTGFETGEARRPDRYLGYVVGARRFEEPGSTTAHIGFDWEHPLTSTATTMLTVNPDWSNIEVAHSGIDFTYLEERRLPEVRPFFVESLPYLPTPVIFYPQRRIYKFDEGLKLTGTEGRFRFGLLGMLGVQRFAGVGQEDDFAARLWYDFSHETYLNVSDVRSGTDECTHVEFVHERKARINARTVAAYYHQSSDLPGLGGSESYLRSYAQTEDWFAQVLYENIGDNLQPALGYTPRRGIQHTEYTAERFFNPKPGTSWFEQGNVEVFYNRALDHSGKLSFEESGAWLYVRQSPGLSFEGGPNLYRHGTTGKPFDDLTWSLSASFFERQPTNAFLGATVGAIEESGYRYFSAGGEARTARDRLAAHLNLEWTRWARRSALSLHGSEENAHQYTLGVTYRPAKRTWLAFSQRWLKERAQSRSIFNAILRRQYGVDHDLYIIFGDPQNPNETVNQVMVKYVVPFGKWGER
jgi:hypothetical protein